VGGKIWRRRCLNITGLASVVRRVKGKLKGLQCCRRLRENLKGCRRRRTRIRARRTRRSRRTRIRTRRT
jgi:hypothetical protein